MITKNFRLNDLAFVFADKLILDFTQFRIPLICNPRKKLEQIETISY